MVEQGRNGAGPQVSVAEARGGVQLPDPQVQVAGRRRVFSAASPGFSPSSAHQPVRSNPADSPSADPPTLPEPAARSFPSSSAAPRPHEGGRWPLESPPTQPPLLPSGQL